MRIYFVVMIDHRPGSPLYGQQVEYAHGMDMTDAQDLLDFMNQTGTGLTYTSLSRNRSVGSLGNWMGKDANGGRARNFFHHENKRDDSHVKNRSLEGDCEAGRQPQDVLRDRAGEQTQPQKAGSLHLPAAGSGPAGQATPTCPASRGRTFARNPTFNSTH